MISFIIPVYNGEKYLRECLDSILGQSFRDMEVIMVNDGSLDHSQEIMEEYATKDQRIRVFSQKNKGVSAARNLGLDRAKGEYIFFLDCDDILLEGAVEVIYRKAVETEADLVVGNYQYYINISGKIRTPDRWLDHRFYIGMEKLICTHFHCTPGNKLWKRSIIEEHSLRFKKFRIGEDMDFYLRYLTLANQVVSMDFCVIYGQIKGWISLICFIQWRIFIISRRTEKFIFGSCSMISCSGIGMK